MDKDKATSEQEDSRSPVEVKKEPVESEDIKDYAANTMNELLAIYGYDEKVDKSVTEDLHLQGFSDDKQGKYGLFMHPPEALFFVVVCKKRIEGKRKSSRLNPMEPGDPIEDCASTSGSSTGSGSDPEVARMQGSGSGGSDLEVARTQLYTAIRSAAEIEERRASYEQQIICAWCQQMGVKRYTLNTATESKAFCSEKCFASCRRAYFKRNKVCDWCRHIRHTKEYVDFQNGDIKLQFCSVKCLNQYKMDVFCKETQSLGSNREYKVEPVPSEEELPSPTAAAAALPTASEESISSIVVGPVTSTIKKSKKPSGLRAIGEARSKSLSSESSSGGACSPLALTTGASNGTMRQIQTMLQNRSSTRIQAQADSTVSSSNGLLPGQKTTPVMTAAPPQAAINAAASVQAAAALQQSTFLGVPAVFQAPMGSSHNQVLGQTPLVVSGNQMPFIPHQTGNVVLQTPQISAPPQIVSPTLPTSPLPVQGVRSQPSSNSTKPPSPQRQQPSTPSSVLPPLTIIVPHPIFVPIPIPIPVPIPIRAEVYDAIKNSADAAAKMKEDAQDFEEPNEHGDTDVDSRRTLLDLDEGRSQSLMNLASIDTLGKESHGILHNRVRILKGLQKPSSSQKSTPNLLLGSFPASNGLHRSASLDLSLASQTGRGKSSLHGHGRKVKTQLVLVGEDTAAVHDGRESSRKVREVLRCHLNKRLSQSALNLAELGLVSTDGGPLRRSHSLSRLRESSMNPQNSLGQVGTHQQVNSLSIPYDKGPTKKPRRVLDNCNRIEEDAETERKLMIHEEEPSNSGTEDDPEEPSCKRKNGPTMVMMCKSVLYVCLVAIPL
ncbi:uncharacterized protein [Amphiura filiformis]|uniref:uncharacterized protein n=1 Tax=Amphiura filiformis TaxID=82378 RepID=UPI003B224650